MAVRRDDGNEIDTGDILIDTDTAGTQIITIEWHYKRETATWAILKSTSIFEQKQICGWYHIRLSYLEYHPSHKSGVTFENATATVAPK